MAASTTEFERARGRPLKRAAFLLGFALSGFFDGILLHQILQWHHLLSGLDTPAFGDLRIQVLADGLFHALMYLIGAAGLMMLWRARSALDEPGAGAMLAGWGLIGFGAWHAVDAVFSHWLTGIHRIRMDSDMPLAWDLGWLVVFGIVPVILGWRMLGRDGGRGGGLRGEMAAILLAGAVLAGGSVAAIPPKGADGAVVVFQPGSEPAAMMRAVTEVGGRVLWTDRSGEVWAIALEDPARARVLYARGALFVSASWSAFGCLAWSTIA